MPRSISQLVLFIFLPILICSMIPLPSPTPEERIDNISYLPKYPPHPSSIALSSIEIVGDASLAAFPNKTGSGTISDPYVIEDLTFIGNDTAYRVISIEDLTKYLVIRNCTILTAGSNIANQKGIFGEYCEKITIDHNTIIGNPRSEMSGLEFKHVNDVLIEGNTIVGMGQGIEVGDGNTTIKDNVIESCKWWGIVLASDLGNITVYRNILRNNSVGIYFRCDFGLFYLNTIIKNRETGIDVYYSSQNNSIFQNDISGNGYAGIKVISENNIIFENNISQHVVGVILESQSRNNLVISNWFNGNFLSVTNMGSFNIIVSNQITNEQFPFFILALCGIVGILISTYLIRKHKKGKKSNLSPKN